MIATGADKIISFDADAALKAGEIADAAISQGRHPGFPDVAIAAIAAARDMAVQTLMGKHFEPLGISFADPSESAFLAAG